MRTFRLWPWELEQLPEYSTSIPTGVCHGKTWKRDNNVWLNENVESHWFIGQYWEINGVIYTKFYEAELLSGPMPPRLPELRFKTQCTTAEVRAWR